MTSPPSPSLPKLTVTITNYNHGQYLLESLSAILTQSYPADEVIVVDDASTDNSVDVIQEFAAKYPTVRLIRNERNMGVEYNVDRMFDLVSGDYVYCASADDRVLPGLFEKSIGMLVRHPEAGLCYSDPAEIHYLTGVVTENRLHLSENPTYFSPHEIAIRMRRKPFPIAGNTSLMKMSALRAVGGLLPELRWHSDWFALLVMAFRYGICYVPEPLGTTRVLPESYSTAGRKSWPAQREILERMLNLLENDSYSDVKPFFRSTGVFSIFNTQILRVIAMNPRHWDYLTPALTRRCVRYLLGRAKRGILSR